MAICFLWIYSFCLTVGCAIQIRKNISISRISINKGKIIYFLNYYFFD